MGAPFAGGEVHGPVIKDMSDRVSWVEKFVAAGAQAHEAATEQKRRLPPVSAVSVCGGGWVGVGVKLAAVLVPNPTQHSPTNHKPC